MIECPSCGRKHRPGTLFCSECGVYLPTGGPLRTEPLPEEELPISRANPWASETVEETRRHCKIHQRGSAYMVEDVGSANGTFLNGQRLTPYLPHVLNDGDTLQLGRIELEVMIQ